MNTVKSPQIEWLLSRLEDPFEMFPLEGVSDTIAAAIDDAEAQREDKDLHGAGRKFWTVETEYHHDEVGLLVGSVFVLGQAAITQTVSILSELRKQGCPESYVPDEKDAKMIRNADLEPSTNLSKIVVINAVANYFKHLYEWPKDWNTVTEKNRQGKTISVARKIGMEPGDRTENLLLARALLERSNSRSPRSRAIPNTIQTWREAWAAQLYGVFELSDPLADCRSVSSASLSREI